jgi:competence protein ComEC
VNPSHNIFQYVAAPFQAERERWLLWAPVGMGLGLAVYFNLPFEPAFGWIAATPVCTLAMVLLRRHWALLWLAGALLVFALGFNAAQIETRLDATPMLDRERGPLAVTGRLMYTEVMPKGVRLTLKDLDIAHLPRDATPLKIRLKLNNKTVADIPPAGTVINLWAQVGPFSDPVMPGATDFRWQSYFRQIGGLGWSFSAINTVDPQPAHLSWRDRFELMFEHARNVLAQHVYARLADKNGGGDEAAMTAARLNGEQSAISKPVIEAMRIAGLAHLLSTSGFHVTIMALLVYFPLRAMLALIPWIALRYPIKKWAACGAILSATAYTLLVGSQAATLRSMLMTGLAMLAILVDRRAAPMRLVILSAALVILIAPDAVMGPSFQMSFAAVFCLIAFNERDWNWTTGQITPGEIGSVPAFSLPGWLRGIGHYIWVIMRTSLIATAATTPFAVYHFQAFSFYGFIANMIAIPLTSFWVMPCILMAYILAPFGLDGWFIDGAGAGIAFTIRIAQAVASWPYSIIYLPAMPSVALVLAVFGGLWLCLWKRRMRWLGFAPLLIAALYPLYTSMPDFMVASDGKEWGARLDDGRLAVSDMDRDAFTFEQWQQRLGVPEAVDVFQLPPNENQLRCDDAGCVYHHGRFTLAMPALESAALEDCARADAVIAPFAIKGCKAQLVIDEPALWRHGAYAITFKDDAMQVNYVRQRRGERPWSPGWGWKRNWEEGELENRD